MESVMLQSVYPRLGESNPHLRNFGGYGARMPRSRKIVSHAARTVREAVARNVYAEVRRKYPDFAISTAYSKIRAATGITLSTMQRIVEAKHGPSTDTLADLAHHLGTTVYELVLLKDHAGLELPRPAKLHRRRSPPPGSRAA